MRPNLWHTVLGAAPSHRVPVLLLPGAMSTARDWPAPLIDTLSERRPTHLLDLREMGRCVWPSLEEQVDYDLDTMAEDVVHAMDVHRLRRVHVTARRAQGHAPAP